MAASVDIILHAEEVFRIGGVRITNSMLLGWIVSTFLVGLFIIAGRRIKVTAGGKAVALVELAVQGVTNLAADVMHDRKRALKYAPFLISLFCFILLNNWFGLLPGVGSIKYHSEPLLRPWTTDLTGTLALAISSILIIQIYALRELGVVGHLKHYFSNKPWNPVNLFIGFLEVLGELTRVASLSLRLFGNVFAGEVLLLVLSKLTSYGAPIATLPFVLLEFFVGFIQAFVFVMLVIVYLALATAGHHDDEHSDVEDMPGMAAVDEASQSGGDVVQVSS